MVAQISRREFLRSAGLAVSGVVLAACAPKPDVVAPPAPAQGAAPTAVPPTAVPAPVEGVELQYWVGWTGRYANTWEGLKETAEFREIVGPNTINVRGSMGGEPLTVAVAGGDPPDLGGNGFSYLDYMARGILLPVDDYVATSQYVKEADFLVGNWQSSFYRGVQYGVPANECFVRYALCYNARMVGDEGLDPDNPPGTWPELLEWHKSLTKFDDAGNLLRIGLDPYDSIGGSLGNVDGFFAGDSWGFRFFDEATEEFNFDNPMMAEIFEHYAEYYDVMGADNMAGFRSVEGQGTWGGSYAAEVQAMMINGYWTPGWIFGANAEVAENSRYSWVPVPDSRSGAKLQRASGHIISIFRDSKHQSEAFKVAEFIQTDVACDAIFRDSGFLPGRPDYLSRVDQSTYPGLDFYFRSVDEASDWGTNVECVIQSYVGTQYKQLGEMVYRREMTGAAAAAEMQRLATEEWSRAGL